MLQLVYISVSSVKSKGLEKVVAEILSGTEIAT